MKSSSKRYHLTLMLEAFRAVASTLFREDSKILVGYSGGADSTCLLHLLFRCGLDVTAAHLHHGQRAEADGERDRCAEFADSLGIPFVGGQADVPKMASDLGVGLEEAGRIARYQFFSQAAFRLGCDTIVTAHTADDHAETILFHIARGSGLAGLRGIPRQRDNIIRPMLTFTREQTREYCRDHQLWFHDDPANEDLSLSRARIRHRVIPELQAINPEVRNALQRLSEIAAEEDDFLDAMAAGSMEPIEIPLNGPLRFMTSNEELALDRARWITLPRVLQSRGLRLACRVLGADLEYVHAQRILESLQRGDPSGSQTLPGGLVRVEWTPDHLKFERTEEVSVFRHGLTLPGETFADSFGWKITAEKVAIDSKVPFDSQNLSVLLESDSVRTPLSFRSAHAGERFAPLGMKEEKLVSDMLQERKLTTLVRRRLPVVCDFLGPIWIPGVAIADRVKLSPSSISAIHLEFGPISGPNDHNG